MAKESLAKATRIAQEDFDVYHNHNSPVQQIASESELLGKFCELGQESGYCLAFK